MKSTFKWTLLSLSIPALIACGGGGGSDNADNTPEVKSNSTAIIAARSYAKIGDRVRLDGASSQGDTDSMLSYNWSITAKPDGSTAALNDSMAVAPYFAPDLAGNYTVELTATAGDNRHTTSYNIEVSDENTNVPPVIMLETPNALALEQTISLNSNSYDADGDILKYQWEITSEPEGADTKLTGSDSSSAQFFAKTAGDYTLRLTVNDGYEATEKEFTLRYSAENVAPVAIAGNPQTFELGAQAQLDGSASFDGNDDAITYTWQFVSKPENSTAQLSSTTEAQPSFTPDLIGDYVVALTTSDGEFNSNTDYVRITATEVGSSDLLFVMDDSQPQSVGTVINMVTVNMTIEGDAPEYILLGEFTVEAKGRDYAIEETTALEANALIEGKLTGLEKGQTLYAGDKARIKMYAKPTLGQATQMSYAITFNLAELRFVNVAYLFTSN
ncbi:PKD domain-containing protein [Vibrio sinaloensis DSM 21326]|uniref:PKD domain-containing protein n=1 Tax=Vibrio sinaloensis DSM 21326 TaxID=945550 RepID=E8M5Q0_PHOS4|nr:PKD domain-containing protein [Vibrio sinaloensis]EGA70622.1 PKD domain-containing protein [Vibrio sinaloensis DSM 21326]